MTILEFFLLTHLYTVKFFLFVLVVIGVLPNLIKSNLERQILWSRVGFYLFWAGWTMVVFSGLLIFAIERGQMKAAVLMMIAASALLAFLDIFRARKLKKIWLEKESGLRLSNGIVFVEILVVITVTLFALKV